MCAVPRPRGPALPLPLAWALEALLCALLWSLLAPMLAPLLAPARTLCSYSPVLVDASAIGTTVLQLKEIPMRPRDFDGKLCLFELSQGTEEASVRAALSGFGTIVSCELGSLGPATAIVRFSTHTAALAVKRAAAELKICGAVDTLYNERSYDGRGEDEEGFEGMLDKGRGW